MRNPMIPRLAHEVKMPMEQRQAVEVSMGHRLSVQNLPTENKNDSRRLEATRLGTNAFLPSSSHAMIRDRLFRKI